MHIFVQQVVKKRVAHKEVSIFKPFTLISGQALKFVAQFSIQGDPTSLAQLLKLGPGTEFLFLPCHVFTPFYWDTLNVMMYPLLLGHSVFDNIPLIIGTKK